MKGPLSLPLALTVCFLVGCSSQPAQEAPPPSPVVDPVPANEPASFAEKKSEPAPGKTKKNVSKKKKKKNAPSKNNP